MEELQIGRKYRIVGPNGVVPPGINLEDLDGWDSSWNDHIGREIVIKSPEGRLYTGDIDGEEITLYPWEVEEITQREWDD